MGTKFAKVLLILGTLGVAACGDKGAEHDGEHGHEQAAAEYERGPHNGRLLKEGDFALEVTIYETGVPPQYRLYAFKDGKPVAPKDVLATVTLNRLGGKVDRFTFMPEQDYLKGSGVVVEPHSFDVVVQAAHGGREHKWTYESHEGRTIIGAAAAAQAGVTTEKAGPASIPTTVDLIGRLGFAPGAEASVKARFPGKILSLSRNVGDTVRAGEVLARVESNESLQTYAVTAPIGGVVVERAASQGDMAGEEPLYKLGDPGRLIAEFHVFDKDMGRVRPGQPIDLTAVGGGDPVRSSIDGFVPVRDLSSQTTVARVKLPNAGPGWMPGMTVRGKAVVEEAPVALAVRAEALQRFRDFEVVFAKVVDTYEVRMLEIGRRSPQWVEVLGGLDPGTEYVTGNSFLIKADIEKSGASHDH